MRGAERGDVSLERRRRPDLGKVRERGLRPGGHAVGIDIKARRAFGGNDRESERHRRMRNVGAADVEGPGDGVGIGDDERVGLELRDLGADALELVACGFAGIFEVVRHHRAVRRRRTVAPDGVDRIGRGRDQHGADGRAGLGEALRALARVQPGVIAELLSGLQVRLDPRARRRVDEVLDRKQRAVDLVAGLGGIAAVDEQRGLVGEDDRGPGRAGEAGEPGEALLARRQIFVLEPVGMRHDEAVEPAPRELFAQRCDARRRRGGFRRVVEGLELGVERAGGGFVHEGSLGGEGRGHNSPSPYHRPLQNRRRSTGRRSTSVIQPSSGMRRSSTRPWAR